MTTIEHNLMTLHDHYVEAVNIAVAADDFDRVERLAEQYDVEALELMHQVPAGRHAA